MDGAVEIGPLVLRLVVGLKLRVCLGTLEAHLHKGGDEVGEEKGVDTSVLPLGYDADEKHIDNLGVLELHGLEQMPPTEGEETTLGLLDGMGEGAHSDTHSDNLAVLGLYDGHHTGVKETKVHLAVTVNLLTRHLAVTKEVGIGTVDDIKDGVLILSFEDFTGVLELVDMKFIAFLHEFCHTEILVLIGLMTSTGHHHLALHPVYLVGKAETLHVLRVVRVVIDGGHRGELVETVDEHTLGVHVGEAERTDKFVATAVAPPLFGGGDKRLADFGVVDEVNPAEAGVVRLPFLVGLMVDDTGYAPYYFFTTQGNEEFGFAEVISRILLGIEGVVHILQKVGHGIRGVFVKLIIETGELFEVGLATYFLDGNSHCCSFLKITTQKYKLGRK